MEIFMRNIPHTVDDIQLTFALEPVLHEPTFSRHITTGGPMNFKVFLFPDKRHHRYLHSGCGTLTLPSEIVGQEFLQQFAHNVPPFRRFRIENRQILFQLSNRPPRADVLGEIQLLPYRDPQAIRDEKDRLASLVSEVGLTDVQFMWQCRDYSLSTEWKWNSEDGPDLQPEVHPTVERPPTSESDIGLDYIIKNMQFDLDFHDILGEVSDVRGYKLKFQPQTRRIVVKESNILKGRMIIMRYSRIEAVEIDVSEKSLIFYLTAEPSYEKVKSKATSMPWMMLLNGILESAPESPREKLISINDQHALVAPYTWNVIRLVCDTSKDINEFRRMAEVENIYIHDRTLTIVNLGRFAPSVLEELEAWLSTLSWDVAFQCKQLYTNMLLDPVELLSLRPNISDLINACGSDHVSEVLRQFGLKLGQLWDDDGDGDRTFEQCFTEAASDILQSGRRQQLESDDKARLYRCLHVTFTPSRMTLTGPFPDTSNRILRQYPNNHDDFLRVSWTDEDGLQFRFDRREINGPNFIEKRVGKVLKNGFTLCGRKFKFLAYSQSALRQYTVWFVHPFTDSNGHKITAETIRKSIGTDWSKESELMRCPARYAARLSQAFTATESSVYAEQGEMSRIPDIERNDFCFSDGNGLVSQEMADGIQDALVRNSGRKSRSLRTPSCFQIRIQGAKGVINIDPTLKGRQILLRPSMVKFEKIDHTDIEIARSFDKPIRFFLNRPLVMILGGLGVEEDVFLQLQADAVDKTNEAAKSLKGAADLLEAHGMGTAFALPSTFIQLQKLGIKLEPSITPEGFRDTFIDRCLKFAIHHVLREIKFKTRIPVADCWKLVGIVDTYNILEEDQIYACIVHGEGISRQYLKGKISISKSPTIHPGDVQIANAIGEPPAGSPLLRLVNCVVFSQRGDRPLPNKLSGSDLDGDEYDLITLPALHPTPVDPGKYSSTPRLRLDRQCNIDDVADFVSNYIINDMLGLVSINFLLIADRKGIFHGDCEKLASLHSWAVDFPKNGIPVPPEEIPYPEVAVKPDWYRPEIVGMSRREEAEYYASQSIIGKMFREIKLPDLSDDTPKAHRRRRRGSAEHGLESGFAALSLESLSLNDAISSPLHRKLTSHVDLSHTEEMFRAISGLFDHFSAELEHIGYSCSLSKNGARRLTEEELLTGTITAKTTQPRIRKDNMASMREATTILVQRALKELEGSQNDTISEWASRSWMAWKVSLVKKRMFGARGFGYMALRAIFEAIKAMEQD
ncbi:RNA dependent RNA polymerase-domain-containing protein [Hysterangium stoloniferum]|nr:RNA dependent RNA polymerase-domain-containing protein [Hysterangium stoloniferum]